MDTQKFVLTVEMNVPVNKHAEAHANERDVKYYLEGAITEYAPKLASDHPLLQMDDDDIRITRIVRIG